MSNTRTYRIQYPVTCYIEVAVDRPLDISEKDLLESVTRDELANGEDVSDAWDSLKDAWRESNVSLILDEEGEAIEFSN